MKKQLSFFFLSMILLIACKPSKQEAVDYQNIILANQMFAEEQYVSFMAQVSKTMQNRLNNNFSNEFYIDSSEFNTMRNSLKSAIAEVNALDKFDGLTTLKTALLELLNTYASFYNNDFPQLVQIINFCTSNNDVEKYLRIKEKMEEKQKKAFENFSKCNSEFIEKYMK